MPLFAGDMGDDKTMAMKIASARKFANSKVMLGALSSADLLDVPDTPNEGPAGQRTTSL